MVISLFRYERIRTTKAKAKEVRKTAEKLVTRAKEDSVHNRRIAAKRIHDKAILAKLFTDIGPRYRSRPGGYTRILKLGFREGDGGEVVILELVDRTIKEKKKPKKEKKAEDKKSREEK
jgi:large subunit ribosomal protein L17